MYVSSVKWTTHSVKWYMSGDRGDGHLGSTFAHLTHMPYTSPVLRLRVGIYSINRTKHTCTAKEHTAKEHTHVFNNHYYLRRGESSPKLLTKMVTQILFGSVGFGLPLLKHNIAKVDKHLSSFYDIKELAVYYANPPKVPAGHVDHSGMFSDTFRPFGKGTEQKGSLRFLDFTAAEQRIGATFPKSNSIPGQGL